MTNDKLFWEKFGITRRDRDTLSGLFGGWEYVDSKGKILSGDNPPEPTLNNLFRYCVPKLQKDGWTVNLLSLEETGFRCVIYMQIEQCDIGDFVAEDLDPAIALKKAIEEIVK